MSAVGKEMKFHIILNYKPTPWIRKIIRIQFKFFESLVEQMLHGKHFIGEEILAHFEKGETWRKVFGPFFMYLNSTPKVSNAHNLWTDAKKQVLVHSHKNIGLIVLLYILRSTT